MGVKLNSGPNIQKRNAWDTNKINDSSNSPKSEKKSSNFEYSPRPTDTVSSEPYEFQVPPESIQQEMVQTFNREVSENDTNNDDPEIEDLTTEKNNNDEKKCYTKYCSRFNSLD